MGRGEGVPSVTSELRSNMEIPGSRGRPLSTGPETLHLRFKLNSS